MEAATAAAAAAVIMVVVTAVVIMSVVGQDTISAAGIMAAAIFTAGRRISVRSPAIVHSPAHRSFSAQRMNFAGTGRALNSRALARNYRHAAALHRPARAGQRDRGRGACGMAIRPVQRRRLVAARQWRIRLGRTAVLAVRLFRHL